MQTGLSHIINAEGEKIQKVIGTTQNIDKLLCVNKSVNETVINVTHLEMVLHSKLATIQEFCGRKVKNYDRLSSDNVCDCVDGDKS